MLKNPRIPAVQLRTEDVKLLENVSIRTIQHRLQKEILLPSRTAARKPRLNERMRRARLGFAKGYQHWTTEQRSNIMWSDKRAPPDFPKCLS